MFNGALGAGDGNGRGLLRTCETRGHVLKLKNFEYNNNAKEISLVRGFILRWLSAVSKVIKCVYTKLSEIPRTRSVYFIGRVRKLHRSKVELTRCDNGCTWVDTGRSAEYIEFILLSFLIVFESRQI